MPNLQLVKGNYFIIDWTSDFIAFDGSPDDTTPGTIVSSSGGLLMEKAAGSERKFYVSVQPSANSGGTGANVTLSVTLPGSGGVSPAAKSSGVLFDFTVPTDHRAANPPNPSGPFVLPHPA